MFQHLQKSRKYFGQKTSQNILISRPRCSNLSILTRQNQLRNHLGFKGRTNTFGGTMQISQAAWMSTNQSMHAKDVVTQVYLEKFGMRKEALINHWLEMSSEELIKTCEELNLEIASDRPTENIKTLIGHLEKFEAQSDSLQEKSSSPDQNQANQNQNTSSQNLRPQKMNIAFELRNQERQKTFNEKMSQILKKKAFFQNDQKQSLSATQSTWQEPKNVTFGPSKTLQSPSITLQDLLKQKIQDKIQEGPMQGLHSATKRQESDSIDSKLKKMLQSQEIGDEFFLNEFVQNLPSMQDSTRLAFNKILTERIFKDQFQIKLSEKAKELTSGEQARQLLYKLPSLKVQMPESLEKLLIQLDHAKQDFQVAATIFDIIIQQNYHQYLSQQISVDDLDKKLSQINKKVLNFQAQIAENPQQFISKVQNEIKQPQMSLDQFANLILLFPNPADNTSLAQPMSNAIKHIFHKNRVNLFSERRSLSENKFLYLVARSTQLKYMKDLQNTLSIFLNQKLVVLYNIDEFLLLLKVISGKIYQEQDLNNVSFLGIRQPLDATIGAITRDTIGDNQFALDSMKMNQYLKNKFPIQMDSGQNSKLITELYNLNCELEYVVSNSELFVRDQVQRMENSTLKYKQPLEFIADFAGSSIKFTMHPQFAFKQMTESEESFAKDVKFCTVQKLVNSIDMRVNQLRVQFDHLLNSASKFHNSFKPFTPETGPLLRKIVQDFCEYGNLTPQKEGMGESGQSDPMKQDNSSLTEEHFDLINRILAVDTVSSKIFISYQEAINVLEPYLIANYNMQLQKATLDQSQLPSIQSHSAQVECLQKHAVHFKMLRKVTPIIGAGGQKNENMMQVMANTIGVALQNIVRDLNRFEGISQTKEVKSKHFFPLNELILANSSILDAISSIELAENGSQVLMQQYLHETPLSLIIEQTMRQLLQKNPSDDINLLKSKNANLHLQTALQNASWSEVERVNGAVITHYNRVLESGVFALPQTAAVYDQNGSSMVNTSQVKQEDLKGTPAAHRWRKSTLKMAEGFLLQMRSSRNLYGIELARLFKLVNQLQESGIQADLSRFDELMMRVTNNLGTLQVNLFENPDQKVDHKNETESSFVEDSVENSEPTLKFDRQDKMGKAFQSTNDKRLQDELAFKNTIFEMYRGIYQRNAELFSEESRYTLQPLSGLIGDIFDSLSLQEIIDSLKMLGDAQIDNYEKNFIEKLSSRYSGTVTIQQIYDNDMAKFLQFAKYWPKIFSNNALFSKLIDLNPESLDLDQQREAVSIQTGKNLIHPSMIEQHYAQFIRLSDRKQVKQCLDQFIHNMAYLGYTEKINMEQLSKVLRRIYKRPENLQPTLLLDFMLMFATSNAWYQSYDEKTQKFVQDALDLVANNFTGILNMEAKTTDPMNPGQPFNLFRFKQIESKPMAYNKILKMNYTKGEEESLQKAENQFRERQQAQEKEDNKSEFDSDEEDLPLKMNLFDEGDIEDKNDLKGDLGDQKLKKRSYERGAKDGAKNQDVQMLKKRQNLIRTISKQENHRLLYSNINTIDFRDINKLEIAKAWSILFHFKSKSLESMLYEEFNQIAHRNTMSKTKHHDGFTKIYSNLVEHALDGRFQLQVANQCKLTGWPIDITLIPIKTYKNEFQDLLPHQAVQQDSFNSALKEMRPNAIYFLVQEEICYNASTRQEEPLAIQKLMIRHLSQISNYRVLAISENEAERNQDVVMQKINDFLGTTSYASLNPEKTNIADGDMLQSEKEEIASNNMSDNQTNETTFDDKMTVTPETRQFEEVGYAKKEEEDDDGEYDPFGDIDEEADEVKIY